MFFNFLKTAVFKNRKFQISIYLLLACLQLTCKKENDQDPVIEFLRPSAFLTVLAGDSVLVEARVQDDGPLSQVSIQLLNLDEVPVTSAMVYHPGNNSFYINTLYAINNTYLESGIYLLTIYASDGKNSSRVAREIEIQAIPLERKKVFAFTSTLNSVQIHSLDSGQGYTLFKNLPGDYAGSSLSSRYQRINVLGRSTGPFTVLDAPTGNVFYQVPRPCPLGDNCFEKLLNSQEMNFIAYSDGNIKGFNEDGLQRFAVQQDGYFIPGAMFRSSSYFYAELYYKAQQEFRIGTFFYPGGAPRQESVLDLDVMGMFEKSTDELYLFGHSNGNSIVEIYSRITNRTTLLRNLGPIEMFSVFEMAPHDFYIATNQGIWNYKTDQNLLSQFQLGQSQMLNYDPIYNEFFIAENNSVIVLDGASLVEKQRYTLPDSIVDIRILYNR